MSIIVNYCQFKKHILFGLEERQVAGNPKQNDDLSDNDDNVRDNLKQLFFIQQYASLQKYVKITGVMILRQFMSIRCQLLSIQGTYFVWVGRATSRWQPKTK